MVIYDSLSKKKLPFKPISEGLARIYACGPTVYDDAHLGHAKSAVSFDLLRRVLQAEGYEVKFARNFTDIDDKILKKMAETGKSLPQIFAGYERAKRRGREHFAQSDRKYRRDLRAHIFTSSKRLCLRDRR